MSEKEEKQKQKEPFFNKGFWISFSISFLLALGIGGMIALIEYYSQTGAGYAVNPLAISVDCFALSGLLLLLFFLLQYFSTLGAFDFLAYSLKTLIYTIFKPHFKAQGFPATYYDYKLLKDNENRKPVFALLFVGGIYLLVGIILYIVYKMK